MLDKTVVAFFGEAGLPYLIIYDQLGTMLIFALYGSVILVLYGRDERLNLAATARRALLLPPTLALLVGLLLRDWPYPAAVDEGLRTLAGMLTPLVMTAGMAPELAAEMVSLRIPLAFATLALLYLMI